jgi:hypothetical protein
MAGIVRASRGEAIGALVSGLALLAIGIFYLTPARIAEITTQGFRAEERLFPWRRGRKASPMPSRFIRLFARSFRALWIGAGLLMVIGGAIQLVAGPN